MTARIRGYRVGQERFPIFTGFRTDDPRCVRNWRIAAAQNPLGFTVNLRLIYEVETENRNQYGRGADR
jgi:hypothetical protein